MPLTPSEWNVVVLGRWNRAILTPSGIAKRLFCLDEETPVEVFVAVDALVPPQVKYGGTIVMAGGDRLIAQPETPDFHALTTTAEVAKYSRATLVGTGSVADTTVAATDIRTVVTRATRGTIELRYAPRDPDPVTEKTSL